MVTVLTVMEVLTTTVDGVVCTVTTTMVVTNSTHNMGCHLQFEVVAVKTGEEEPEEEEGSDLLLSVWSK